MNRSFMLYVAAEIALFLALTPGARCSNPAPLGRSDILASQNDTASSQPADCSTCHAKYFQSLKNDKLLISVHAKAGTDQCTSCHEEASMEQSHANVTGPVPVIKAQRYPGEFCLRCHGTLSELAKKTANSKSLVDTKGRVVNPHDLPKTPAHAKSGDCANCHRMHKAPINAVEYCFGCHHKRDFACMECHGEKGNDIGAK